jgi:hypothetical protein
MISMQEQISPYKLEDLENDAMKLIDIAIKNSDSNLLKVLVESNSYIINQKF